MELYTLTTTFLACPLRARRLGQQDLSLQRHMVRCNSHTGQPTLTATGGLTPLHMEGHPWCPTLPTMKGTATDIIQVILRRLWHLRLFVRPPRRLMAYHSRFRMGTCGRLNIPQAIRPMGHRHHHRQHNPPCLVARAPLSDE